MPKEQSVLSDYEADIRRLVRAGRSDQQVIDELKLSVGRDELMTFIQENRLRLWRRRSVLWGYEGEIRRLVERGWTDQEIIDELKLPVSRPRLTMFVRRDLGLSRNAPRKNLRAAPAAPGSPQRGDRPIRPLKGTPELASPVAAPAAPPAEQAHPDKSPDTSGKSTTETEAEARDLLQSQFHKRF
jgi:hypothetical protein